MLPVLRPRIGLKQGNSQFCILLDPSNNKIPKFPRTKTFILGMGTQSESTKRPTCPSCSKPSRICLCNRLQTPALHNSVSVTILQHSLEKKHPLNSTRVATIGLKNVDVVTVNDVNFQAQFFVWLLHSCGRKGRVKLDWNSHVFDEMPRRKENDEFVRSMILGNRESGTRYERNNLNGIDIRDNGGMSLSGDQEFLKKKSTNSELHSCSDEVVTSYTSHETMSSSKGAVIIDGESTETCCNKKEEASTASEAAAFNFTIEKHGKISSYNHGWMTPNKSLEISFDHLLISDTAVDDMRKGFVVKKLQKKPVGRSNQYEGIEEFEIAVPPGSVLLFPSEKSVDVEALGYEVKNLIVLDGTWAKAKRMYNENPWLRFLPHIKLDIDTLSLYSEVRQQPRAGYLSTIESIVYALKAVGEDSEGLDGLLDVFESMVGDQRRCMSERLSKASEI